MLVAAILENTIRQISGKEVGREYSRICITRSWFPSSISGKMKTKLSVFQLRIAIDWDSSQVFWCLQLKSPITTKYKAK